MLKTAAMRNIHGRILHVQDRKYSNDGDPLFSCSKNHFIMFLCEIVRQLRHSLLRNIEQRQYRAIYPAEREWRLSLGDPIIWEYLCLWKHHAACEWILLLNFATIIAPFWFSGCKLQFYCSEHYNDQRYDADGRARSAVRSRICPQQRDGCQ